MSRASLLVFAAAMACTSPRDTAGSSTDKPTVRLGHVELSFYAINGELVKQVLEGQGYRVERTTASHPEIYELLGNGELDLLAGTWLPNAHGKLYEEYGGDDVTKLTAFYGDARLYWAVPSYVPEREVASVADLAKERVAARMSDTIAVVGPGSGLETGSQDIFEAYGLADAGYTLATLPADEWSATLGDAVADESWAVIGLWQPQYLNDQFDVRILAEPRQLLGGRDTCYLVAADAFLADLPDSTRVALEDLTLSVGAVTDMDYAVNVEGRALSEVVSEWLAARE